MSAEKSTRVLFWSTAALIGFAQAWSSRMSIVNDTVSYLDIGHYLLRGEWSRALSGEWNPLYAALLGLVIRVFQPSPYWEYPLVHALLFVVFLLTCACFELFLRELLLLRADADPDACEHFPRSTWRALGYVVFLWGSLELIRVSETNPDMLIAASFCLACAILVRIRRAPGRLAMHCALGATLGLGYLVKAIMFPVALVCLGAAALLERGRQQNALRGALAGAATFLVIAGPYVAAISLAEGKPTISESGWYNALRDLEGIPESHWQGGAQPPDKLIHPTRLIFKHPATFEFAAPLGGTYPVWYDPSYWYRGAIPHYSIAHFTGIVARNLLAELRPLTVALNGSLVTALLLLWWIGGVRGSLRGAAGLWFVLIPAGAGLALYALRHVETRFLGGFFAVCVVCLLSSPPLRGTPESRRLLRGLAVVLWLMFLVPLATASIHESRAAAETLFARGSAPNPDAEVVRGLRAMGLEPGDRIALLEYGNCAVRQGKCLGAATWAHLGDFRIVSEVYYSPDLPATAADDFWSADQIEQQGALRAMALAGARVAVSLERPRGSGAAGWRPIGTTGWYVLWLANDYTQRPERANAH